MGLNHASFKPGQTRANSEQQRKAQDARVVRAVLCVTGISPGRLITVGPSRFGMLDVDPAYQRGETAMVGQIVRALQGGGQVLDPVTLCTRPWGANPDTLWIVDGHQRVCAFQQLGLAFQAMVHESESLDAEKQFFVSLNSRKAVSADLIVKSWTGPAGDLLRSANEDPAHPIFERVHMQQGTSKGKIGGMILARAAMTAATGLAPNGEARLILSRLDTALGRRVERARAEHMVRLMALAFKPGKAPNFIAATALAYVANERLTSDLVLPKASVLARIRGINWQEQVPALNQKYLPVLTEIIRKIWK